MAKAYASGKNAFGFCDRCGFRYPLADLRRETINENLVNIRTCPRCHDEDHPQYRVGRRDYHDPQALRNPRSDTAQDDSRYGSAIRYEFDTSVEGWTTDVFQTLTWLSSKEAQLVGVNGTKFISPVALALDSTVYRFVRVRVKVAVDPGASHWGGTLNWKRTIDGGFIGQKNLGRPTLEQMGEDYHVLTYDVGDEVLWSGTIEQVYFQTMNSGAATVLMDYVRFEEF
jgi:hypothetical protein